jgi:hypothetical protein
MDLSVKIFIFAYMKVDDKSTKVHGACFFFPNFFFAALEETE